MENEFEGLDWINARNVGRAQARPPTPPKVDKEISDIVGKIVYINDPRLIKLVIKWKRAKDDPEEKDEFLKDGARITELKRVFNPERFGLEPLQI